MCLWLSSPLLLNLSHKTVELLEANEGIEACFVQIFVLYDTHDKIVESNVNKKNFIHISPVSILFILKWFAQYFQHFYGYTRGTYSFTDYGYCNGNIM